MRVRFCVFTSAKQPDGRPWRNYKGNQQRENHGSRSADRNRSHIRAHQTADKSHWQNRANNRQCGKYRRVSHFVNGLDCDLNIRPAPVFRKPEVTDDIFHNNNGIINQDADGKDECKKRNPI